MCGLAVIHRPGAPAHVVANEVATISAALAHRGPDGEGMWSAHGIALAHRRLAMLDAHGGGQPMWSPDRRFVVVLDGEITNHDQLRRELASRHRFRTRSDTEVLAAAWSEWGTAVLQRLNGMFAFVVWDTVACSGVAVRDRLGIKPMVWRSDADGSVRFASEAKAVLSVTPRANLDGILEYLTAPAFSGVSCTPFRDVEVLPAGCLARFGAGPPRTERWIEMFAGDIESLNSDDAAEAVRSALVPAIERTQAADAPVATYLSGGFDSTLVTAVAQRRDPLLRSFSVRFEGRELFDAGCSRIVVSNDEPMARAAAAEIGVDNTFVDVDDASLASRLRRVVASNDRLPAWEQEIAQDALAVAASVDHRAVMVGDAADETHFGYQFLLDDEACASASVVLRRFANPPIRSDVLADPIGHFACKYESVIAAGGHFTSRPEQRRAGMTHLIVARWLARLLHNGDIHAMASGLESRVPFGDINLLDVAQRVSPNDGFAGGIEKALLRSAATGLLPEPNRLRTKSALPKAATGWRTYQAMLEADQAQAEDLLEPVLDITRVRSLLSNDDPDERDQGLLFRLAGLITWFDHYGVTW